MASVETITVKPQELTQALAHLTLKQRPAFIWGPPGIGKSQIVKQVAADLNFIQKKDVYSREQVPGFRDIRLADRDPTDLRGIPYPAKVDGESTMVWSPPSFYERNRKIPTLYFFDEMNAAQQSIQAAAYQIVLDRRIGDYALGPDDVVFAAGNRETDRGAIFKMSTALMNRFIHLELRVDFEDWQQWALSRKIHKSVVGYLNWQKHELFEFKPSSASRGFPTPRSWEFVSDIVNDDPNVSDNVLLAMVSGAVGEGAGIKFMAYRKLNEKLPNPSDILNGKITKLTDDQKETSIMFALTIGLCYELREKHDRAIVLNATDGGKAFADYLVNADNFFHFMMENFQSEMTIMGARTILAYFKLKIVPTKMPHWRAFATRHNSLIVNS